MCLSYLVPAASCIFTSPPPHPLAQKFTFGGPETLMAVTSQFTDMAGDIPFHTLMRKGQMLTSRDAEMKQSRVGGLPPLCRHRKRNSCQLSALVQILWLCGLKQPSSWVFLKARRQDQPDEQNERMVSSGSFWTIFQILLGFHNKLYAFCLFPQVSWRH